MIKLRIALVLALLLGVASSTVAEAQPAPQGIVVVPPSPQIQVNISVSKPSYQPGERIRIDYNVSTQAYVYLVDIDALGNVTQIFPNGFSQNNFVSPGAHSLPDSPAYSFVVTPPAGTELVQIIASLQPIDLGVQGFVQGFPNLGNDPSQFQQQAQAAIQGIVPTGEVATAFASFQVGGNTANRPPVASFSANPSSPNAGQAVTFDASASFDPDGFITNYSWDFNGDGVTDASGVRVSRTFFVAGQQRVTLSVRDNGGQSAASSQFVQVGRPSQPPVAGFNFAPSAPSVGQAVVFDAGSSFDPDGFILSYSWDFNGDGVTDASGVRVSKAFFVAGQQRVTLRVRDNDGLSATSAQTLQVGQTAPSTPGFFVDSPNPNLIRIRVQGQSTWAFQNHAFRIRLETDGVFTSLSQQGSGLASPQGISPVPNRDVLDLSGAVGNGTTTFFVGVSNNASNVKFDLRLDLDADGTLEQLRSFVFLGDGLVHPPSDPFVLNFSSGNLTFNASLKVCLVLVNQPGIHFSVCFRFNG